jgi:hypothetical protein
MRLRSICPLTPAQSVLFAEGRAPLDLVECCQGFGKQLYVRPATSGELEWCGQAWQQTGDRWEIWPLSFPLGPSSDTERFSRYDLRKLTEGAPL